LRLGGSLLTHLKAVTEFFQKNFSSAALPFAEKYGRRIKQSKSCEKVKSGEWAAKMWDGKIDSSTNSLTSPPESVD
jgi:hypothetical protein